MSNRPFAATFLSATLAFVATLFAQPAEDGLARIQGEAILRGKSPVAYWGTDPHDYVQWGTHSNRLIPIYAFGSKGAGPGVDLESYQGKKSPYRDRARIEAIYGRLPEQTVDPAAEWFDQTDLFRIQQAAVAAGKKHVIVVVFDGMDWQTTRAAAIYAAGQVAYDEGRGSGLFLQEYDAGGTSQFGYVVTSSRYDDVRADVDRQITFPSSAAGPGGYASEFGGTTPWSEPRDAGYLIGKPTVDGAPTHPYPDSAATATSICTGEKTYNAAIGVDETGRRLATIAHEVQAHGWSVGVVTSVPISHATPAAAYAHNVSRDDYQDLSRDLLGLPSVSHPETPLPGMDVVIGAGFGAESQVDKAQGSNFVAGNRYLTDADRKTVDVARGGRYAVAERTADRDGGEVLREAAAEAIRRDARLLGIFGVPSTAHLPFRTADGDYRPVPGRKKEAERYVEADVTENPTLREMAEVALERLSRNEEGFWLMVEAGDVDWANHDDNLDNSIGAVLSGDDAVQAIAEWVEKNSDWHESLLLVTADHGHSLYLTDPQAIADAGAEARAKVGK